MSCPNPLLVATFASENGAGVQKRDCTVSYDLCVSDREWKTRQSHSPVTPIDPVLRPQELRDKVFLVSSPLFVEQRESFAVRSSGEADLIFLYIMCYVWGQKTSSTLVHHHTCLISVPPLIRNSKKLTPLYFISPPPLYYNFEFSWIFLLNCMNKRPLPPTFC